ncbi:MAG: hypothetical protein M1817_001157 [Caeruleum heppii]|nr:MAG: hypothetical protein M1817_001157 [Caeruleum heppii]
MALVSSRIFTSRPFRFLIGEQEQPFTIHSTLVAQHSKPLSVLVNGPMSEAQEGSTVLKHVDEETFGRFCEWAYTGDYHPFEKEARVKQEGKVDEASEMDRGEIDVVFENDGWDLPLRLGKKGNKKGRVETPYDHSLSPPPESITTRVWKAFYNRSFGITAPVPALSDTIQDADGKPTDDLLTHARIYIFAEMYDIPLLRKRALSKLHQTLIHLQPYHENDDQIAQIVRLIEYTYNNTTSGSREPDDDLRSLVIHYAACVVETLEPDGRFRELLEAEGSMARELLGFLCGRLG